MAWWETGEGEDVSSDEVADILTTAFEQLLADGDDPATVLRVWQDALNAEPRALLDGDAVGYRLSAELRAREGNAPGTVSAAPKASPVARRRVALDALREVAGTYGDAKDRGPRPSELAYALRFSWGEAHRARVEGDRSPVSRVLIEPLAAKPSS